jgi:hypothetical protein
MNASSRLSLLIACLLGMPGWLGAQTATLFTVEENGPRSERINIVFLSEGYTTADMPNFTTHVTTAVNFLFSKEPWKQYRSYCNIYRIEIASNQSGCDYGNTSGSTGTRDTYFNAGYFGAGAAPTVEWLLALGSGGLGKALTLVNAHVPESDMPVVLVNDTKYGGAGYSNLSVASIHASSAAIVEHEIGHSFASLTDEYESAYPGFVPTESYANATAQTTRELVKWRHWFDETTPVPTPASAPFNVPPSDGLVGLFQGAIYQTSGWYRPHFNSLMRSLSRPCGQVNREQFVLQFYQRVSPLDGFTPVSTSSTVSTPSALSFQVTPKVPTGGAPALAVSWKIDGIEQSGAVVAQFNTLTDFIGNGTHTVTATVRDPTSFVRLDTSNLLSESVTWNLTLSGQIPATLAGWRTAYGADTAVSSPDQLANLIKYSLGLDASVPATVLQMPAGTITPATGEQHLTLTIPRRMKRTDVIYTVQVSSDLSDWRSGAGHTVILEDSETRLVVRDALPISSGGQRFIRLAVQPVP